MRVDFAHALNIVPLKRNYSCSRIGGSFMFATNVGCESTERNENRSEMRALITMLQKCSMSYETTCA